MPTCVSTHSPLWTCSPPAAPTLGMLQEVTVGKTEHIGFLGSRGSPHRHGYTTVTHLMAMAGLTLSL